MTNNRLVREGTMQYHSGDEGEFIPCIVDVEQLMNEDDVEYDNDEEPMPQKIDEHWFWTSCHKIGYYAAMGWQREHGATYWIVDEVKDVVKSWSLSIMWEFMTARSTFPNVQIGV
jgi:hypothetical protein